MNRTSALYFFIITFVCAGIAGILHLGNKLPANSPPAISSAVQTPAASPSVFASVEAGLRQNANDPLSRLFLQLLVIITASRLAGWLFTRFGQPAVVGEMAAGILLGPSLFGLLAPDLFQFVFPVTSLGALKLFSQIGVCLFMFAVGMDLDVAQVRNKAQTAVLVSHASIVVPYFLGVVLALFFYSEFAQPGASFTAFALFMGISMSITAFPVLARILQERGLSKTVLGSTAITCAAVDDVTAWSVLAFVVAIVRASSVGAAMFSLSLVLIFVALMLWVVKPGLPRWIGESALEQAAPSKGVLAAVVGVVLAAALTTELLGIHALFGAFLTGAIMPTKGDFRHKLSVRVENFSSVLLLPLFFAFTGLRTQFGMLNDLRGWLLCLAIIAVATTGKLGGTALTARLTGLPWRESLQLGALMNTRGLMELIALNIGYDLGILSPPIFTMLVIMALATTAMTGPLLTLFEARRALPVPVPAH
ncbi:MAG: cation/H(+) antiporter [Chthoniobacteraceae bacterium]|nr:cation/H(+) antiporter [Chthoniobacteraceae bacterium]